MLFVLYSVIFIILIAANIAQTILLTRAAKRLLQFDDIMQAIFPVMGEYSADLKRMSSGDLLIDSPEVAEFHRRNLQALKEVESIVEWVAVVAPQRKKEQKIQLPRPEVE